VPNLPELVWLLRHAETATPGIFHGAESDVELSALGQAQSAALAEWFRELRPTVVVTSHMKRAIATALPTVELLQIPHVIEPDFHERRVGILSGTDFTASGGIWSETIANWTQGNTAFTSEGAESFDNIRDRVVGAWQRTIERFPGERVLIVAHGVVCKVLVLTLLKPFSPADWLPLGPIANCAVTTFQHVSESWQDLQLLQVPPPVLALSDGQRTGIGTQKIVRHS
jgi:2,3-bisphosphoglycerate-dependent phosphoglycerate mutase